MADPADDTVVDCELCGGTGHSADGCSMRPGALMDFLGSPRRPETAPGLPGTGEAGWAPTAERVLDPARLRLPVVGLDSAVPSSPSPVAAPPPVVPPPVVPASVVPGPVVPASVVPGPVVPASVVPAPVVPASRRPAGFGPPRPPGVIPPGAAGPRPAPVDEWLLDGIDGAGGPEGLGQLPVYPPPAPPEPEPTPWWRRPVSLPARRGGRSGRFGRFGRSR